MVNTLNKMPFACPKCRGALPFSESVLHCAPCNKDYPVRDGVAWFMDVVNDQEGKKSDDLVFRIKLFFKRFPHFFFLLYNLIAFFTGKSAKKFVASLPADSCIVSVGSGAKMIDERVVNIDISYGKNVDIVASVYNLPFSDESIDALVSESLMEHLEDPEAAIKEIHRVLKKGASLYIVTPFMLGFHSSPHDFYRWTIPGMRLLLKDFSIAEAGVAIGPTGAMVAILREWCAMVLSFGNHTLYQLWTMFFMIVFIPLNLFDLLLKWFPFSSNIALAYYVIGRKK